MLWIPISKHYLRATTRDLLVEALVDNGATKEQAEAMLNKLSASDVEKEYCVLW